MPSRPSLSSYCQALLHAGVVAPLARALRRHYRRPEVVKQACGSCWLLAQGDGRTKAQLGEAGAVEALVRAMGHHNLHHHHHRYVRVAVPTHYHLKLQGATPIAESLLSSSHDPMSLTAELVPV